MESLRYGDQEIALDLTGARSVRTLVGKDLPVITDMRATLIRALNEDIIRSAPLRNLLTKDDRITIVVSDLTRFWMRQDRILEPLVDYMIGDIGIPAANIVILIALGTHRPQTEDEMRRIVSEPVYRRVRVVNHDCDAPNLAYVGTTSRGTAVWVNPLVLERKVILVGGTLHHLMAGFGGGRKNLVPGVAGRKTILQNHIHSLDPAHAMSNPQIGVGKLDHNPVNEDMDEAAALIQPLLSINIVVNGRSEHCALFCGHWREAWLESCRFVMDAMGVPIAQKADIVVVSCGGYPKDINLYQGVKSLLNASYAVRDGGTILFLAECREGGGADEYFNWIHPLREGRLDAALRENFTIAGYIFYASVEAAMNKTVNMLTEIPAETLAPMNIRAFSDVRALQAAMDFRDRSVYLMPYGGNTVPLFTQAR